MALMTDSWTQDPQVREDRELRSFLDELATTATEPVDPVVRAETLEAMLAEAAARHAPTPAATWRRRARQVLAMTGVKVVLAGGVAAAATTGGLAATGTLPAPVQQFAHEVGQQIGIGFPAAPGQARKQDGDPDSTGRDHAPGQLQKTDDDPASTGRDHAPGQVGREDVPAPPGRDSSDEVPPGLEKQDGVPPGQQGRTGEDAAPKGADPPADTSAGASDEQPSDLADEPGRPASAPGQDGQTRPQDAVPSTDGGGGARKAQGQRD